MKNSPQNALKTRLTKRQTILWIVFALSGISALITVILMDFTNFGVPKIQNLAGKGLIDSSFYYSGEKLYAYLENFNGEALKTLLLVHAIDYVFMISVCIFEITVLALLAKGNYKVLFLAVFASLELFFDLSENLFVDFVIRKLPEKTTLISGLCGGMTLCKWIFTILYLISAVSVLVFVCVKKIKTAKDKNLQPVETKENNENVQTNSDEISE